MLVFNGLTLPIIALLSALLIYVVAQNPHAAPNRLFGAFAGTSLLIDMGILIQQNVADRQAATFYGAVLAPLLALNYLLLIWLVLAVFLPERYAQQRVRWLIATPALIALALTIQAPLTGVMQVFDGFRVGPDGRLMLTVPRGFNPLLGAYILGTTITMIMTAAIAIRRKAYRLPATILFCGLLFSQLLTSTSAASQNQIFYIIGPLPTYVAFAWITIRYQLFRPSTAVFQRALDQLPDGVLILDAAMHIRYANTVVCGWLNLDPSMYDHPLPMLLERAAIHPLEKEAAIEQGRTQYMRTGAAPLILEGNAVTLQERHHTVQVFVLRDVTQREQQAAALANQNAEQRRLLELVTTLETPTIALANDLLLVPIIGKVDTRRAQALMSRLLEGVSAAGARRVIMDLAGITEVDTNAIQALIQTTQALRLLGCQVTLTSITPPIAQTLTLLGAELAGIEFARSPQEILV